MSLASSLAGALEAAQHRRASLEGDVRVLGDRLQRGIAAQAHLSRRGREDLESTLGQAIQDLQNGERDAARQRERALTIERAADVGEASARLSTYLAACDRAAGVSAGLSATIQDVERIALKVKQLGTSDEGKRSGSGSSSSKPTEDEISLVTECSALCSEAVRSLETMVRRACGRATLREPLNHPYFAT